jgi:hypothetical protein
MDPNRYEFRSVWQLDATRDVVFEVLADLCSYPAWWPEVPRAERIDDATFDLTVRSLLPYDLVFRSVQGRRDREAGVLEVSMSGDLHGFSRWTICDEGATCVATFEEQVTARKPLLRRLAPIARPAFQANHWLMMRHGRAGLRTFLRGYAAGLRQSKERPMR